MSTRAERRREMKLTLKKGNSDPTEKKIIPAQSPLAGSFFLLSMMCWLLAFVLGAETWIDAKGVSLVTGWAVIIGLGLAGFFVWVKTKWRFVWGRRWVFLAAGILSVSFLASMTLSSLVASWAQKTSAREILANHQEFIELLEKNSRDNLAPASCQPIEDEYRLIEDAVFEQKRPPNQHEMLLMYRVAGYVYQIGCGGEAMWDRLVKLSAPKASWQTTYPISAGRVGQISANLWPNTAQGCYMELDRAKAQQKKEMIVNAIDFICKTRNQINPWSPGQFTNEAQAFAEGREESIEVL